MQLKESAPGVESCRLRETLVQQNVQSAASTVRENIMQLMSHILQVSEQTEPERFFSASILQDSSLPWPVTLQLQDSIIKFKIDRGA